MFTHKNLTKWNSGYLPMLKTEDETHYVLESLVIIFNMELVRRRQEEHCKLGPALPA